MFFEVFSFIVKILNFLFPNGELLKCFTISVLVSFERSFFMFEEFIIVQNEFGKVVKEDYREEKGEKNVEDDEKEKVEGFQLHRDSINLIEGRKQGDVD